MSFGALQLAKYNENTNFNDRIHGTPIVQYARIIKVINACTVIAESVVRTALSRETYTVTLLSLSSALTETRVSPEIGDKVLLLFLQYHDPKMFVQDTVENPNAAGYNCYSGVGILMSTAKSLAETVMAHYKDGDIPVAELTTNAEFYANFNNSVTMAFCRAMMDSDDEQVVSIFLGQGRPLKQEFLSKVTREYGFWRDGNDSLIELDAAVDEKYSEYAPITKDIQGKQSYKIGIGEEGDTEAPVDIELGENADITVASGSGLTMKFDKAVLIESGDGYELKISGDVTISGGGDLTLKTTTGKIAIKNSIQNFGTVIDEFLNLVSTGTTPLAPSGSAPLSTAVQIGLLRARLAMVMET